MGVGLVISLFVAGIFSMQVSAGTIYDSPYVSFSPDGKAWTTDAGEKNTTWYEAGETVYTGISSTLRELRRGEHYYQTKADGTVPIGYWRVEHRPATCIHADTRLMGTEYHDLQFRRENCLRPYYSGWRGYCADCGRAAAGFIYMSLDCAKTISYLPADMEYYYLCPNCTNLEQGAPFTHICKKISANRYKVRYNRNAPDAVGYMDEEYFFYDNAAEFEGNAVTPRSRLATNTFSRTGYVFDGWNTESDGSGDCYADGAQVLNLTDENWERGSEKGVVKLYAMWRPAESFLQIDPGAGSYKGKHTPTMIAGLYGTKIILGAEDIEVPLGSTVSFETGNDIAIKPLTCSMYLSGWRCSSPMHGLFKNPVYYYLGEQGDVDYLTAEYVPGSIILPIPEEGDRRFIGWYFDKDTTSFAGRGGDAFTPREDVTLYAGWTELMLASFEDYAANDGKGAVDLKWTEPASTGKTFKIFQKSEADWRIIGNSLQDEKDTFGKEWRSTGEFTYKVPSTGLYRLAAIGASGENYENRKGGLGGVAEAVFWLSEGEMLTIKTGAINSGNKISGGFSSGGESTSVSSNLQGILLIAGGGGGATGFSDGGNGGSNELLRADGLPFGESGPAGGGAGYVGGTAGAVLYHSHEKCTLHRHGGGCYESHVHTELCYQNYVLGLGSDQREDYACGCRSQVHHFLCTKCGRYYSSMTYNSMGCREGHNGRAVVNYGSSLCHSKELICGMEEVNYLICTRAEGYDCGKTEGVTVDKVTAACGGSNYVNEIALSVGITEHADSYGPGAASLQAVDVGYMTDLRLDDVAAPDKVAPGAIERQSILLKAMQAGTVRVHWEQPEDAGTVYYHQVKEYIPGEDTPVLESNVTENLILTGVKGYYYLADTKKDTVVRNTNGLYTENRFADVSFVREDTVKYLHAAAVDAAGNVGETIHIRIEYSSDSELLLEWEMLTDRIGIKEGANVYKAPDGRHFVKADGETPFFLQTAGFMEGPANSLYQPNYIAFEVEEAGDNNQLRFYVPSMAVSGEDTAVSTDLIQKSMMTDFPLEYYPYTAAVRGNRNKVLSLQQGFTISQTADGENVTILPRAGAEGAEAVVWSDRQKDRQNAICLVADGTTPILVGEEQFSDSADAIREGMQPIILHAYDEGSGLDYITMRVINPENTCERTFFGERGLLSVTADPSEPLWQGCLRIEVEAADNVGNMLHREFALGGVQLEASVRRILEPHAPAFKSGESGVVEIHVTGYVREIEVIYPDAFLSLSPEMNQKIVIENPEYSRVDQLPFVVPLYASPAEKLPVVVRTGDLAGNREEKTLYISVIESAGGILGELRTRLR